MPAPGWLDMAAFVDGLRYNRVLVMAGYGQYYGCFNQYERH
jgi:hypothetical protein